MQDIRLKVRWTTLRFPGLCRTKKTDAGPGTSSAVPRTDGSNGASSSAAIANFSQQFRWLSAAGGETLGRERGQAAVRVIATAAAAIYLAQTTMTNLPWLILAFYAAFSIGFLWHVARTTMSLRRRRFLTNASDMAVVSCAMITAGEPGMWLLLFYFWITLGNGFRFGRTALFVSAVLGLLGFSAVVAFTPAWQLQAPMSMGILSALVVLPLGLARTSQIRARSPTVPLIEPLTALITCIKQRLSIAPFRWLSLKGGEAIGRERGQAVLRVVVISVAASYLLLAAQATTDARSAAPWVVIASYWLTSVGLLVHVLRTGASSPRRRLFANVGDMAVVSYTMVVAGESGMPLFLLYLWITLGNGFRFGEKALLVSALLGVIGFASVVAFTQVWQTHEALSTSIFLALIILPLYTAHLIRQLNKALAQAQEASAAKSQFLARMSHELRTPLNGIHGATELFESGRRLSSQERELVQVIRDSVDVSLRQINNVLDFSKLEAGKLTLDRTDVDLHEVVHSALDMVRPTVGHKSLRLFTRIAPETPFRLVGDPHHLRAILLNLLSNAVKFTDAGHVCIEVSGRATAGKTVVRFEVHDTGVGIAPASLNQVFESFSQEETSTSRRYGGTGLGTTIAKQLVELMDGRMGVESVKRKGSMFWFEVPLDVGQATAVSAPGVGNARVLVVTEDSETARRYTDSIGTLGGVAIRVHHGRDALDTLARSVRLNNPVHAICVDAALAISEDGEHRYADLVEKAHAARVGVFLMCDIAPPAAQLRQWGYAAVLAADPSPALMAAALHSVRPRIDVGGQAVVTVPPWIWSQRERVRPRIFVADDNRTNLMIVRRMLERAGYEVEAAETGDAALDRLSTGNYRLAILDMHMPGLDGLGVLRRYRLLRARSRMPVLILTANATLDAQGQCADAGADAYLSKPVAAADLLGEVERLIRDAQVEQVDFGNRAGNDAEVDRVEESEVLDIGVLAELDRLYNDPRELARTIAEYEREGNHFIECVAQTCAARNHAAFCDAVHTLKGNAGNVGAVRLMDICRRAESASIVEFMQSGQRMLAEMRTAFADTLSALREQLPTDPHGAGGSVGES